MKSLLSVVLLLASLYARGVYSYTVGAPIYACDALAPIPIAHNGPPQTTTVPYTIDLSSFNNNGELQYNPEESYTCKLLERCVASK